MDYCMHHHELYDRCEKVDAESISATNLYDHLTTTDKGMVSKVEQTSGSKGGAKPPAIKLNELVKKPESFDGYKPPARRWVDDYEKASQANGWSEELMVRYFSTFLEKAANDWFLAIANKKLGLKPTWSDLKSAFIRHYLGDSDKQVLRRQVEKCQQGDREKATIFIPRFMRMVQLVDPSKPEDELVEVIRSKLRDEYQEKLVLTNTYTIEQLNDACLKIEASIELSKAGKNSKSGPGFRSKRSDAGSNKEPGAASKGSGPKFQSRSPKSKEGGQTPKKDGVRTCYKCDRKGHVSADCRASTKWNGEPLNVKPTSKVNVIGQTASSPSKAEIVSKIRAAGSNSISTVQVNSLNEINQTLITHPVNINGVELQALIDTGAFVSVINHQIVVEQGWLAKKSKMQLIHAAGEKLDCIGEIETDVEITIGAKSLATKYKFLIVKNLCASVLVGLELMKKFKLTINPLNKVAIAFQRGIFKKGVRLAEELIIPARCAMIVKANVSTTSSVVATVPFGFDNHIMVANSVANVVNSQIPILVLNMDTYAVNIKKQQQVASFQALHDKKSDTRELQVWGVNNVLPLADTSSYVKVGDDLSASELKDLSECLARNIDAFSTDGTIGFTKLTEHKIVLDSDAKPFREKARRHPLKHVAEAKRQVKELLEQNIIQVSDSPWCSEYVMVAKKTGEWRMCVDFRRLNTVTKKDSYPLPNIEECLEMMCGNKYFSQIDFASGYWQLPVAEQSQELTAFRVGGEIYHFKRLPFGLTNAPATFQRLMNALFAGLKGISLQVFLDDVCLATSTWSEHIELLEKVLQIIIKANLRLKGSKCSFGTKAVKFLGHQISELGLKPDPCKVEAIKNLPVPQDVSAVRRILGAFGYYRKFIPKYAEISEPLVKLTRKRVPFNWGTEEDSAFNAIKEELASCITLTNLNAVDPVILKTDASIIGIAGLLIQEQNKELRIVACVSRHLKPAEKNYTPMELEALAVVYSLQKFRHFLLGRHFKIITDHNALKVLNSKTTRNARVERWALALAEYDYEIVYQRGRLHEDVDCLSRAPIASDTGDQIMNIVHSVPLNADAWKDAYVDEEATLFLEKANDQQDAFYFKNDLIYRDGKLYVPQEMRSPLIKESHESTLAAHDGVEGTMGRLSTFWWPNLETEVKTFVEQCFECQQRKVERRRNTGLMRQHESFQPMEIVAFDYLGPLPETLHGKKFIIVAIDHFTRFVDAKAVKDQIAERFIRYFASFCGKFGIPKRIVSDNAKQFDNKCLDAIREQFGTEHQVTPAGHSQGNAICERVIQSISDKLAVIIANATNRLDWELALPMVLFSINSKVHSSTGYAPFELLYGRPAPLVQKDMRNLITPHDLHAQVIKDTLSQMRANAIAHNYDAHIKSKNYYDRLHRETSYNIDDLVLIKVKSRSRKLGPKFEGPYKVITRELDIYTLENNNNPKDKRRRHVSQMKLYTANVAAIALLVCIPATAFTPNLPEALPIIWQEDNDHFVSQGEETLQQIIQYESPCSLIVEYAKLLDDYQHQRAPGPQTIIASPANSQILYPAPAPLTSKVQADKIQPIKLMRQPKLDMWTDTEPSEDDSPIEDNQSQPNIWLSDAEAKKLGITRPKRQTSPLLQQSYILATECNKIFNQTVLALLNSINDKMEKRQMEFITGFIVSNIVSTIQQFWKSTTSNEDWQTEIRKAVLNLNTRTSILSTALRANAKMQKKLQQELAGVQQELQNLPNLDMFCAYIISEIQNERNILQQFAVGLNQEFTNTILLSEILKVQQFDNIKARDASVIRVKKLSTNTLQLTITGHIRSKTNKIYRVKDVAFYTNWTTKPVRHEYLGKKLVVKNTLNDCIRAVDETNQKFVEGECNTAKYIDPQLKVWRKTVITNVTNESRHSQYLRAGSNFIISCWGNNISIARVGVKGFVTTECPTYTFMLNSSYSFKTSDNLVQHISKKNANIAIEPTVILDVSDTHFEAYNSAHQVINEQNREINVLLNKADKLGAEINATIINGTTITWRQVTYYGIGTSSIMVLILGMCCVYYKYSTKIRIPKWDFGWQRNHNIQEEVRQEVKRTIEKEVEQLQQMLKTEKSVRQSQEIELEVQKNFNRIIAENLSTINNNRVRTSRRSQPRSITYL